MLLTQRQRLGLERVVFHGASWTGPISGFQRRDRIANTLEQVSNGAGAKVQGAGDGRRGLATP